jgi:hypothetical protein
MKYLQKYMDLINIFLLIILIITVGLTFSPNNKPVPHRDSGIFLNIGSEILRGKILYLQTWDQKQPLIYLINAGGLWIGNGSVWGVWSIEFVFLVVSLLSGYSILRRALNPFISLSIVVISFLSVFQFMSGNFTEEYAIMFQMGILALLFLVYLPDKTRFSQTLASLGIGVLAGLVFCIKQTYLDVAISAVAFLVFLGWSRKNKIVYKHLLLIGLGFVIVNFPVFFFFYTKGALSDYIFSAFLFNKYYSSQGLLEWIHTVLEEFEFLSAYPTIFISGSIWLGCVFVILWKMRSHFVKIAFHRFSKWSSLILCLMSFVLFGFAEFQGGSKGIGILEMLLLFLGIFFLVLMILGFFHRPGITLPETFQGNYLDTQALSIESDQNHGFSFLFLGILDLPIVLGTISLSGMNFPHYFISLFPALFLILGGTLIYLHQIIKDKSYQAILNCFILAIFITGSFVPILQVINYLKDPLKSNTIGLTAEYIKSVTNPKDKILVWGWGSTINFLADRESPTRYPFQMLAFYNTPNKQVVLLTLLEEITANPPVYIADMMDPSMPFIEGKTTTECLSANPSNGGTLQKIIHYVCLNYEFVKKIDYINIYKIIRLGNHEGYPLTQKPFRNIIYANNCSCWMRI